MRFKPGSFSLDFPAVHVRTGGSQQVRTLWADVQTRDDRVAVGHRPRFYLLSAAFWLVLIAFVSFSPTPPGIGALGDLASRFADSKTAMRLFQGIIHMLLLGVWAVLCAMLVASFAPAAPAWKIFALSIGAVVIVGIAIEIAQSWVPKRVPGLTDLLGDVVGAVLFLSLSWLMRIGPFRVRSVGT